MTKKKKHLTEIPVTDSRIQAIRDMLPSTIKVSDADIQKILDDNSNKDNDSLSDLIIDAHKSDKEPIIMDVNAASDLKPQTDDTDIEEQAVDAEEGIKFNLIPIHQTDLGDDSIKQMSNPHNQIVQTLMFDLLNKSKDGAEKLAVAYLAQLPNISKLVNDYSNLTSAVISVCEYLGITIERVHYSHLQTKHDVSKAIITGGNYTLDELMHAILKLKISSDSNKRNRESAEKREADINSDLFRAKKKIEVLEEQIKKYREPTPIKPIGRNSIVLINTQSEKREFLKLDMDGHWATTLVWQKAAVFSTYEDALIALTGMCNSMGSNNVKGAALFKPMLVTSHMDSVYPDVPQSRLDALAKARHNAVVFEAEQSTTSNAVPKVKKVKKIGKEIAAEITPCVIKKIKRVQKVQTKDNTAKVGTKVGGRKTGKIINTKKLGTKIVKKVAKNKK